MRYSLTKYTNKESTFHNNATFSTTSSSLHVSIAIAVNIDIVPTIACH